MLDDANPDTKLMGYVIEMLYPPATSSNVDGSLQKAETVKTNGY